ncbi:dihydroneopterin aldolase [Cytophagaceae bacterium ABcell3]|nr:dihydroneopterin aldolase [Cytophagaceae bacterium ABcell3]
MLEISLNGLEFIAHHGYFKDERVKGNRFLLDITVFLKPPDNILNDELESTVDYCALYNIADEIMKQPSKLLETVVEKIAGKVLQDFTVVESVEVALQKMNPPIGGVCSSSRVKLTKKR